MNSSAIATGETGWETIFTNDLPSRSSISVPAVLTEYHHLRSTSETETIGCVSSNFNVSANQPDEEVLLSPPKTGAGRGPLVMLIKPEEDGSSERAIPTKASPLTRRTDVSRERDEKNTIQAFRNEGQVHLCDFGDTKRERPKGKNRLTRKERVKRLEAHRREDGLKRRIERDAVVAARKRQLEAMPDLPEDSPFLLDARRNRIICERRIREQLRTHNYDFYGVPGDRYLRDEGEPQASAESDPTGQPVPSLDVSSSGTLVDVGIVLSPPASSAGPPDTDSPLVLHCPEAPIALIQAARNGRQKSGYLQGGRHLFPTGKTGSNGDRNKANGVQAITITRQQTTLPATDPIPEDKLEWRRKRYRKRYLRTDINEVAQAEPDYDLNEAIPSPDGSESAASDISPLLIPSGTHTPVMEQEPVDCPSESPLSGEASCVEVAELLAVPRLDDCPRKRKVECLDESVTDTGNDDWQTIFTNDPPSNSPVSVPTDMTEPELSDHLEAKPTQRAGDPATCSTDSVSVDENNCDQASLVECILCLQLFPGNTDLYRHYLNIHATDKVLTCRYCAATFPLKRAPRRLAAALCAHMKFRHSVQLQADRDAHPCVVCLDKQTVAESRKLGLVEQTAAKEHQCRVCLRYFETDDFRIRHGMKKHNLSRDDFRPPGHLPCELCPRTFRHTFTLACHQRDIHQVPMPAGLAAFAKGSFPCKVCLAYFGRGELNNHVRTKHQVHGKVPCRFCARTMRYNELTHHFRLHHTEIDGTLTAEPSATPAIPCKKCGKVFRTLLAINKHRKFKTCGMPDRRLLPRPKSKPVNLAQPGAARTSASALGSVETLPVKPLILKGLPRYLLFREKPAALTPASGAADRAEGIDTPSVSQVTDGPPEDNVEVLHEESVSPTSADWCADPVDESPAQSPMAPSRSQSPISVDISASPARMVVVHLVQADRDVLPPPRTVSRDKQATSESRAVDPVEQAAATEHQCAVCLRFCETDDARIQHIILRHSAQPHADRDALRHSGAVSLDEPAAPEPGAAVLGEQATATDHQCHVCLRYFKKEAARMWHGMNAHNLSRDHFRPPGHLPCGLCPRTFRWRKALAGHQRDIHQEPVPTKPIHQAPTRAGLAECSTGSSECLVCLAVMGRGKLTSHVKTNHEVNGKVECRLCARTMRYADLSLHFQRRHTELDGTLIARPSTKPAIPFKQRGKVFRTLKATLAHNKNEHGGMPARRRLMRLNSKPAELVQTDTSGTPVPVADCAETLSLQADRDDALPPPPTVCLDEQAATELPEVDPVEQTAATDHQCHVCLRYFKTDDGRIWHGMNVHGLLRDDFRPQGHLPCELCPRTFTHAFTLACHQRDIHQVPMPASLAAFSTGSFQCRVCLADLGRGELKTHVKTTHEVKGKVPCRFCSKTMRYADLILHFQRHHTELDGTLTARPSAKPAIPCKKCGKVFSTMKVMRIHNIKEHRGMPDGRRLTRPKSKKAEFGQPSATPMRAVDSGGTLPVKSPLKSKTLRHGLPRTLSAVLVQASLVTDTPSASRDASLVMVDSPAADRVEPLPDAAPTLISDLPIDESPAQRAVSASCSQSSMPVDVSASAADTVAVLPKVFDYKPGELFVCTVCQVKFGSATALALHGHIHLPLDEPSVLCPVCLKVYKRGRDYSRHLLLHRESVGQVTCSFCMEAMDASVLLGHIKRCHAKEDRVYIGPDKLAWATRELAPKNLNCPMCKRKLRSSQTLEVHVRQQHGVPVMEEIGEALYLPLPKVSARVSAVTDQPESTLSLFAVDNDAESTDPLEALLAALPVEVPALLPIASAEDLFLLSVSNQDTSVASCDQISVSHAVSPSPTDETALVTNVSSYYDPEPLAASSKVGGLDPVELDEYGFPKLEKVPAKPLAKGLYMCVICQDWFCGREGLRTHNVRIHGRVPKPIKQKKKTSDGGKKFLCKVCQEGFTTETALILHKIVHRPIEERCVHCPVCLKVYQKRGGYAKHLKTHTDTAGNAICRFCALAIPATELPSHIKSQHAEPDQADKRERGLQLQQTLSHGCHICPATFLTELRLQQHIGLRHGESLEATFKHGCKQCPRRFSSKHSLGVHTTTHREGDRACPVCLERFSFSRTDGYAAHLRSHYVDDKIYKTPRLPCRICGSLFSGAFLEKHLSRHIPWRSDFIHCPICREVCEGAGGYDNHITQHQDESGNLTCRLCQLVIPADSLMRHLVSDHPEQHKLDAAKAAIGGPGSYYQCAHCPDFFTGVEQFQNHLKVHPAPPVPSSKPGKKQKAAEKGSNVLHVECEALDFYYFAELPLLPV